MKKRSRRHDRKDEEGRASEKKESTTWVFAQRNFYLVEGQAPNQDLSPGSHRFLRMREREGRGGGGFRRSFHGFLWFCCFWEFLWFSEQREVEVMQCKLTAALDLTFCLQPPNLKSRRAEHACFKCARVGSIQVCRLSSVFFSLILLCDWM
jgi:hypothetical protein